MIGRAARQAWHLFLLVHTRRHRATFFGYAWLAVGPLAFMAPLLIAGQALDFAPAAAVGVPYATYALSGLVLWQAFAGTLLKALVAYRLTRKRARRLQIEPLAPLGVALIETGLSIAFLCAVLVVVAAWQGAPLSASALLFPAPALVAAAAGACVALPLVLADAVYRDAQRASGFIAVALLWATPVVHLPPDGTLLAAVARWNPLSALFDLWRALLIGDGVFALLPSAILSAVAVAVALTVIGRAFVARFWEAIDYVR